jgi:hypothetical protein
MPIQINALLRSRLTYLLERLEKDERQYREMAKEAVTTLARIRMIDEAEAIAEAIRQTKAILSAAPVA